jgi:hypothetical protein
MKRDSSMSCTLLRVVNKSAALSSLAVEPIQLHKGMYGMKLMHVC